MNSDPGTIVIVGCSIIAVAWFTAASLRRRSRGAPPNDAEQKKVVIRQVAPSSPPPSPLRDSSIEMLMDPVYVTDDELVDELEEVIDDITNRKDFDELLARGERVIVARITHTADGDSGAMKDTKGAATGVAVVSAEFNGKRWIVPTRQRDPDRFEFRVHGADAWEMAQGKAGELGAEFSNHLLLDQTVIMVLRGQDDYGRWLCDIILDLELPNGEEVEIDYVRAIIRTGRAINYRGSKNPDGDPELRELEERAHQEGRGRWQWPDDAYLLPHDWRHRKRKESAAQAKRRAQQFAAAHR